MSKKWFAAFLIFVLIGVGYLYYREIERITKVEPTAWQEDHRADCAVVVTGGPGRVREGFDLLAQREVRKLIISGVYPKAELREIFPRWPFYGPLNPQDVILEKRSGTTYGNAQQSLPLIEALHCRDVVLITSHLHMYRAYRIFRSVFPVQIPVYSRAIVAGHYRHLPLDLFIEATKSIFYSIWAY